MYSATLSDGNNPKFRTPEIVFVLCPWIWCIWIFSFIHPIWCPLKCITFNCRILILNAVAHCGPLSTVIWWSHSPILRQCRPVLFCGWSNNLEWTFNTSKAPPKRLSNPHLLKTVLFRLAWVGILKGHYINFDCSIFRLFCIVYGVEDMKRTFIKYAFKVTTQDSRIVGWLWGGWGWLKRALEWNPICPPLGRPGVTEIPCWSFAPISHKTKGAFIHLADSVILPYQSSIQILIISSIIDFN